MIYYWLYLLIFFEIFLVVTSLVIIIKKVKSIDAYINEIYQFKNYYEDLLKINEKVFNEFSSAYEELINKIEENNRKLYQKIHSFENDKTQERQEFYIKKEKCKNIKKEYIEALKLAQKGMGISQIAKETKIGKGEVKLLLELNNNKI